jgi:TIR domain
VQDSLLFANVIKACESLIFGAEESNMMQNRTEIFLSYADEDENLRDKLEIQLASLEREGLITIWHKGKLGAGDELELEVKRHLNTAQIILLLVSASFMVSPACYDREMMQAMDRQDAGKARVIPIILSPVEWQGTRFGRLGPLPMNSKPVTTWQNRDLAFLEIVQGVRKAVEKLTTKPLANLPKANQTQIFPDKPLAGRKEEVRPTNEPPLTTTRPDTQPPTNATSAEYFDVFLSHSHVDADWVERLARRLEDEHSLRVWLDKWVLVAGQSWQQAMARGIDQAGCCAICIGEYTPIGWFKREIERALDRQTRVSSFRVIPVLLPNAKRINVDDFLELNTWVDFRGSDQAYAFHVLVCGVKGISPGRWPPK